MVHRFNGRGTYAIDRLIDGVGRIKRASGTNDLPTKRRIDAMITTLDQTGEHGILREIQTGRVTALVVYGWYREGKLGKVPMGVLVRPLAEMWEAWVLTKKCSVTHKRALRQTVKHVGGETVGELAERFAAYVQSKPDTPTTLTRSKMHLLAFLRKQVGESHPLYLEVAGIEVPDVVVQDKATPLSPSEVRQGMNRMSPEVAEIVWGMCVTGMNKKEFWGVWRVVGDRIEVAGTKRASRARSVVWWTPVSHPRVSEMTFRRQVAKAWQGTVRPHDFRATAIRWWEEAGIIRSHRTAYAGHKGKSITEQYELGELPGQLAGDAAKMRVYLPEQGLRVIQGAG